MDWGQVCTHIETLNREMGAVQTSVEWIKYILHGQMVFLVAILGISWRSMYWSRRNGNGKR